jgi:segregation and condensation protein A
MTDPTFHLEGIVKNREELDDFEGPLTLILQLLSKNKIEIRDIQIAQLLDQYLAYLDEMKTMDLEIASEFVSMASYLVYIKTKMLLTEEKEPSELEQLMCSLETLRGREVCTRIRGVTSILAEMYRQGSGCFSKPPEPERCVREYIYSHDKNELYAAMRRVLASEDKLSVSGPQVSIPRPIIYSVTKKSEEILMELRRHGALFLNSIYKSSHSRTELVATFIALLELCGAGAITITDAGDDLLVTRAVQVAGESDNGNS